jgi:hypothetical protein
MKYRILFTCAAASLLISHVSLGYIHYDADCSGAGSPTGTCTSVRAGVGTNTTYDSEWGNGYESYYTDTGGYFDWYGELYARTAVVVNNVVGPCEAEADAIAVGSDVHGSGDTQASCSRTTTGETTDEDDPRVWYMSGDDEWLDSSEGVSVAHYASMEASVGAQNQDMAYAMVEVTAWCSMSE